MPIQQDQYIAMLKAAAFYRKAYHDLMLRLNEDISLLNDGGVTVSLPSYISALRARVTDTYNQLNVNYGSEVEVGLKTYTPARLNRNKRLKERQKQLRDAQQPFRKRRAQATVIDGGPPPIQHDYHEEEVSELPLPVRLKLEEINKRFDSGEKNG